MGSVPIQLTVTSGRPVSAPIQLTGPRRALGTSPGAGLRAPRDVRTLVAVNGWVAAEKLCRSLLLAGRARGCVVVLVGVG